MLSGELTGVRVRQAWQAELGRLAVQWFGEGGEDESGAEGGAEGGGFGDAVESAEGAGLTEEEGEEAAMAQYMQAQSKGAGAAGD